MAISKSQRVSMQRIVTQYKRKENVLGPLVFLMGQNKKTTGSEASSGGM